MIRYYFDLICFRRLKNRFNFFFNSITAVVFLTLQIGFLKNPIQFTFPITEICSRWLLANINMYNFSSFQGNLGTTIITFSFSFYWNIHILTLLLCKSTQLYIINIIPYSYILFFSKIVLIKHNHSKIVYIL